MVDYGLINVANFTHQSHTKRMNALLLVYFLGLGLGAIFFSVALGDKNFPSEVLSRKMFAGIVFWPLVLAYFLATGLVMLAREGLQDLKSRWRND